MARWFFDGLTWYRAELPPGVHPLDPDAADRVIRWVPCPPPPHARHGRPAAERFVDYDEAVIVVVGVVWLALVIVMRCVR